MESITDEAREVNVEESLSSLRGWYTPRSLARRLCRVTEDKLPLVSEAEIRAWTRKRKDPLPCISVGSKRPIVKICAPVFLAYLAYVQGVADYAEVVKSARGCTVGARP